MKGKIVILVENLSVPFDRRVWREARALAGCGYQVSVVCPRGRSADRSWYERREGVHIYRYPGFEAQGHPAAFVLEFALALILTTLWLLWVFLRRGFHVIQICNPPDLLFLVTLPYKVFRRAVIFDHHDLAPETWLSRTGGSGGTVYRALRLCEKWTIRTADVVMSTNESYRRLAIERDGADPDRVHVVRNGPELAEIPRAEPSDHWRRGRSHLVFYVGTMGPQDGVDYLLRALADLHTRRGRTDLQTVIMGSGSELDGLRLLADELRIAEFVTFTGQVPHEQVMSALASADIGVCPDPRTPLNDLSTMIKTIEYMAMGKPIVGFDLHETKISAGPAALLAENDDPVELADCIATLLDDAERREAMGREGARRVAEGLAWDFSKRNLFTAYADAFAAVGRAELARDCG